MGPELAVSVSRRSRLALVGVVMLALAVLAGWYVNSPQALPTGEQPTTVTTTAGQAVFVTAWTPGEGFGRTLRLHGVKVTARADRPVEIVPLLCKGGSLTVTSDASAFCEELVNPEGETLDGRDALVLEVRGSQPGTVQIDRIRVGFREGVRYGTLPAGRPVLVDVVPAPGLLDR